MSSVYLSKGLSSKQLLSPMQEKYFSLGRASDGVRSTSPPVNRTVISQRQQYQTPKRSEKTVDKTVAFED